MLKKFEFVNTKNTKMPVITCQVVVAALASTGDTEHNTSFARRSVRSSTGRDDPVKRNQKQMNSSNALRVDNLRRLTMINEAFVLSSIPIATDEIVRLWKIKRNL